MSSVLRIMSWNANGLTRHKDELQVVLNLTDIDICLISETHFTNQSNIKFKGYSFYHTNHPDNSARGGSAVLVKESIKHSEDIKFSSKEFQATSIKVQTLSHAITVAGLYSPPRQSIQKELYVEFLKTFGDRFIIGGDFNAKNTYWGSRLTSTKGRRLLSAINENNCEALSSGNPTYWPTDPNKTPDLIDFFVIKNISSNYLKIEDSQYMHSDHSPIILTVSQHIIKKPPAASLTNSRTDWSEFQSKLDGRIQLSVPLQSEFQLDLEVEKFMNDIQQSAWDSTPNITKRVSGHNYPLEIRNLVKEKRRARRKWHQTRSPQDKNVFNRLTRHLTMEIKSWKDSTMSAYLTELSNEKSTDYSLWKATKNLKRPIAHVPPIQKRDGTWARNNKQKADTFAIHLESIFHPHDSDLDESPLDDFISVDNLDISPTSLGEIKKIIKDCISAKKAPGFDLITGNILKNLTRKSLVKICHLMNASFRLKYVPQLWKVAEVLMIPKPGKPPNETTSYRPISLLPVLSKVFEKLLVKRINPIIESRHLIPNHQFGFRTQHSTIDQVHRITDVIEKALEEKKVCSVIFLDVAQAFDKVWHEGLIHKLRKQLPVQYADILQSYISDRYFRIKQEDEYSELKPINAGVPQGSVLGPVLYLLYTNDLPTLEHHTIATFADDTAIMAVGQNNLESTEKLQNAINRVQLWTKKWRIKLNESKSVHVDFTNRNLSHKPVFINEQIVPFSNTAKYLGMTLDAKLRWKPHVKRKLEELKIKFRKMYWLLGRSSTLSIYNKLLLYQQILKPIWMYGIQLWGCTCESTRKTIQTFQNKVLRCIVGAPWYVRNVDIQKDLNIPTVNEAIKHAAGRHHQRLNSHVNIEAYQLTDNNGLTRRLRRIKPFELV